MNMLERCAKAARDANAERDGDPIVPWEEASPDKRAAWMHMTQAVLDTLATEKLDAAMVGAGEAADMPGSLFNAHRIFTAMIRAAGK